MPIRIRHWICGTIAAAALLAGCQKIDESAQPEFAAGDQPGQYMPAPRPAADLGALGDQTSVSLVAKRNIRYGPLPEPEAPEAPAKKKPADTVHPPKGKSAKPASGAARTASAQPGKRTRLGASLSQLVNMIPGRHATPKPPASAPPAAADADEEDEEPAEAPAKPAAPRKPAAKLTLADPRGPLDPLPDSPKPLSEPQLKSIRAAAEADAVHNLMRQVFAVQLDPATTVGDAVGQGPDDFPGRPDGLVVVDARWLDDGALEVTVQLGVTQLVAALAHAYPDHSFDPLMQLGEAKAVEAKGMANLSTESQTPPAKPAKKAPKRGGSGVS
ncbi:MAG: hypothetical protein U1A27_04245 [Phycisphaerae bacterium]